MPKNKVYEGKCYVNHVMGGRKGVRGGGVCAYFVYYKHFSIYEKDTKKTRNLMHK